MFLREDGKFELNEPYSAGAWIRTERTGENQTLMGISGELGTAWRGWDFFLDIENRPSIRFIGYWPHNYMQITANVSIPKDEWHHVLFTYDGSGKANGLRLYVDGERAECGTDFDELYRTIALPWGEQEGWPQKPVMVGRSGAILYGRQRCLPWGTRSLAAVRSYAEPTRSRGALCGTNRNGTEASISSSTCGPSRSSAIGISSDP